MYQNINFVYSSCKNCVRFYKYLGITDAQYYLQMILRMGYKTTSEGIFPVFFLNITIDLAKSRKREILIEKMIE